MLGDSLASWKCVVSSQLGTEGVIIGLLYRSGTYVIITSRILSLRVGLSTNYFIFNPQFIIGGNIHTISVRPHFDRSVGVLCTEHA